MGAADRIADTILRIGEIQGDALTRAADIRSRAIAANGQIWGQAIQSLGNLPGQTLNQIQQYKNQQLENQTRQMQLDRARMTIEGERAGQQLWSSLPKDQNGLFDVSAVTQNPAFSKMLPEQQTAFITGVDSFNKVQATFGQQRAEHAAMLADSALKAAKESGQPLSVFGASLWLNGAANAGLATPDEVKKIQTALVAGADPTKLFEAIRNQSPKFKPDYQPLPSNSPGVLEKNTGTVTPVNVPRRITNETELAMQAAGGDPAKALSLLKPPRPTAAAKPGSFEDYVIRYAQSKGKTVDALTTADLEDARKRWGQADDKVPSAAEQAVVSLSPAGLDAAALQFKRNGTLPPMGMGPAAAKVRTQIINRAAALTPDDIARIEAGGMDIAGNKATYGADSGSLKKLQAQRDAIGAFEKTASKNIDIFLNTAGKVVDTGSPLANSLVRAVNGKVLGSPDQAAYDAARQVAINEIAKITSNPNLSGTLSDSARKEVEAFNPNSATLKQTVAVMRLLQQDMQNRTTSLDAAIADIKQRMGGGSTPKATDTQGTVPGLSYQDYLKRKGAK